MKINIFNIEIKFPLFDKSNSTSISNMIEFIILLFLLHLLYFFPSYNEQQHHRTLWHKCEIKAQLIFHGIFGKTWNIWTRSFHSNSAQNHIITRHQYSRALAHLLFFLYSMFFFDVLLERNGLGLNIFFVIHFGHTIWLATEKVESLHIYSQANTWLTMPCSSISSNDAM